jgi:hypothetical protein
MPKDLEENSTNDPIEELKRIVNDVEQKGEKASEHGRDVTRAGQFMVDFARATKAVITYLPPNANVEYLIEDWNAYNQQANRLIDGLQTLSMDVVSSTNSTAGSATLSVTGTFIKMPAGMIGSLSVGPEAQGAIDKLYSVAGRMADASRVEELLKEFGFDKAPKGIKSPLELFQTAHAAYEKPVIQKDPISTSLIPMRECIEAVIAELLKRRPTQEEAKNEQAKIMSIGRQFKRDTILLDTIDSLARQWHEKIQNKELSAAKQQDITREEWSIRLQRATQFLFSLLSGLDIVKMKRR